MTRDHLAAAFGVDVRTVSRWVKEGLPKGKTGFSLPECISWFGERGIKPEPGQKKKTGHSSDSKDTSPWLEAFRMERARMAKMERRKMAGNLLPKDEVVRQFTTRAFEFGRALLQLGHRFSAKVASKCQKTAREVEAIHEREARKLLEDYARPIEIKEG